jgi:DNA-binding LytR/AlgR family response regulator
MLKVLIVDDEPLARENLRILQEESDIEMWANAPTRLRHWRGA